VSHVAPVHNEDGTRSMGVVKAVKTNFTAFSVFFAFFVG
jgi:hypothetical protein